MAKVLVIGLNPAWQKVLEFDPFIPGAVNRAQSLQALASGKGMNTAKVLRRLGHAVWLLQILGGENGRRCQAACEEAGIKSLPVWVDTETRVCLTVLQRNPEVTTEIIEPFQVVGTGLAKALLAAVSKAKVDFAATAICGSIPSGLPEGVYGEIVADFPTAITVVDSCQGLRAMPVANITCIKVNRSEYHSLSKTFCEAEVPPGSGNVFRESVFLVTSGEGEATVIRNGDIHSRFSPPRMPSIVNPIGAGDTVTAAVTHFLLEGMGTEDSFRRALAMGSASCLHRLPGEFSESDYTRLLPLVEKLS